MISINKNEFDENIEEFTNLLIEYLSISHNKLKINISNVFLTRREENVFSLIQIILSDKLSVQFTVSFDVFYSVPILNFRVYIDDLITFNIDNLLNTDVLKYNKNVDLQVGSHPILQDSWFSIHPCETSQVMSEFLKSSSTTIRPEGKILMYLSTWFNLYGLCNVFPEIEFRPNLISYYSKNI